MVFARFFAHLIVGECAVLVDGVGPGDDGADGLALEDALLLALREERDLVVDVLQDHEDGRLACKLLRSIVLRMVKEFCLVCLRMKVMRRIMNSDIYILLESTLTLFQ